MRKRKSLMNEENWVEATKMMNNVKKKKKD